MNQAATFYSLAKGLRHSAQMTVAPRHTVPEVAADWPAFRDMPPVFATAMMVGFIEATCIDALRPYLGAEQRTVGTKVEVSHIAATPVGMQVTAKVELIGIDGRRLRFQVECLDEAELIGSGFHERTLIEVEKFTERLRRKSTDVFEGSRGPRR